MPTKREIGNAGEDAVCRYLIGKGFEILARNYIAPHGEIDIIASDAKYIVFCEVKTRKETAYPSPYGRPARAVNARKQAHLLSAADAYLKKHYGSDRPNELQPRMDVAEVVYTEENDSLRFRIRYMERAFGRSGTKQSYGGWE